MDVKLPKHVAIVLDGNGRWATNQGLPRVAGHAKGKEAILNLIPHIIEKQIPILSIFVFSSENWTRSQEEVAFLMQLFLDALTFELETLKKLGVKLKFCGERTTLSAEIQQKLHQAEHETRNGNKLILNVAMNYGGKWDILTAAKSLALHYQATGQNIQNATEAEFASFLSTQGLNDPDLFIRTSGELRLSNFLLWQMAYTELYFTDVNWPDFTPHDFDKALAHYAKRQRRYGNNLQTDKV